MLGPEDFPKFLSFSVLGDTHFFLVIFIAWHTLRWVREMSEEGDLCLIHMRLPV